MSETHPHTLITIKPRGPYRIEGDWRIVDPDGHALPLPERKDPRRISLCGCGQSRTWPICDGTHKTLATDAPSSTEPAAAPSPAPAAAP